MKYVHHKSNLGYVLLFGLTLTFGPSQAEFAQWFGPEQPIALPTASQVQVAIGDLDSDSVSDVVCVDNNGLKWLRGLGGGSFAPYKGLPTTGSQVRELELVDLDSDGALDIFLLFRHGHEIGWLRGNGQGGFDPHALISNAYDGPYDADFADLDGDSDLDIVVAYLEGDEVRWIENAGSGVFGYPAAIAGIGGAKAVTTLDVDGDGDFDVVAAGGDTRLFTNDGMGGFSAPVIIDNQAGSPYCLETADIDGDGKPDVVAGSRSDYVAWFRNNGVSLDPRAVISSSPDDVSEVVVGDFNGDGWLDVASCSRQDDSVYWYKNLGGAAAWSEELVSSIADEAIDLAHGDLDEDGVPDLAVACWSGKKVAWHENLHTFDCNGNGIPDDQDIAAGTSEDCNGNLSPDECDLASGASTDLDADGQLDDFVTPPLYADTFELSVASGGTQHFTTVCQHLRAVSGVRRHSALHLDCTGDLWALPALGLNQRHHSRNPQWRLRCAPQP